MRQRGRKSVESLSIVRSIPGQRFEPPEELTPAQAEEWRRIVGSLPADWFAGENLQLLADYCRNVIYLRDTASEIEANARDRETIGYDEWLARFGRLSLIYERHSRAASSLATRMRLTQQSRYNALSASTASRRGAGGAGEPPRRPWEIEAAS